LFDVLDEYLTVISPSLTSPPGRRNGSGVAVSTKRSRYDEYHLEEDVCEILNFIRHSRNSAWMRGLRRVAARPSELM